MTIQLPRLLALELTVIATAIIAYFAGSVVSEFAQLALVIALAILVTYALLPGVNFLAKFKYVPRGLAVVAVYLGLLAVVAGFIAAISVPAAQQVEQLADDYPKYSDQLKAAVPEIEDELQRRNIKLDLQAKADKLTKDLEGQAGTVLNKTGDIAAGVFGTLSTIFIVLFVSVYFLLQGPRFTKAIIGLLPVRRQRLAGKLSKDYDRILGSFVRGQLLISGVIILVVGIFAKLIGLPYSLIIGVIAGITSLIPTVGVILGMVLPIIISAFVNPILIPVFIGFFLVLNEVTDKIIYPRVVGRAVELHPLAVFFGILIGIQVAGIAGALLATPVLALLRVTFVALRNTTGNARRA